MKKEEFLAVSIHEFAHFIDLYSLEKKVLKDISFYFYALSWESTKVLKPGLKQKDFVSGYAMTNKYEDFAESFTYYVLHNKDFLKKSEESKILQAKYNFLKKNVFRKGEFLETDFSEGAGREKYYRDITKISFHLEKLLIFVKK
jgi:hypothetical protein